MCPSCLLFPLSLSFCGVLCLFDQALGVGAQGFERVCCVFWQMEGLTDGRIVPTGCSEERKTLCASFFCVFLSVFPLVCGSQCRFMKHQV